MTKICDACEFLNSPSPKTQILDTKFWSVGLGDNLAYFGRAYMTLKSHKGSLGSLSDEEWVDFKESVRKIEEAYKDTYGAEPLNWSCCMNHAFREEPFNPHVHWHIYPRYSKTPVHNGVEYKDKLFGSMYDSTLENQASAEVIVEIAEKLKKSISQVKS